MLRDGYFIWSHRFHILFHLKAKISWPNSEAVPLTAIKKISDDTLTAGQFYDQLEQIFWVSTKCSWYWSHCQRAASGLLFVLWCLAFWYKDIPVTKLDSIHSLQPQCISYESHDIISKAPLNHPHVSGLNLQPTRQEKHCRATRTLATRGSSESNTRSMRVL